MSDRLTGLRQQFAEKDEAYQAAFGDGSGLTAERAMECESLVAEMGELANQIRAEQANSRHAALTEWAAAPQMPVPFGGSMATAAGQGGGTYGNGVTVLGITPSGEAVLENSRRGFEMAYLDPKGMIDKAFGANAFTRCAEDDYKLAWHKMLRGGWHGLSNAEQAALQEGVDTSGGYLVPDDLLNRIIAKEPTPTRVAARTTQLNTSRDAISIPKVNYSTDDLYTTGIRATWTGEIPASATTHRVTEPVFGQVRVPVYTAMLSMPVTNDLVEDSMVGLMDWLGMKFNETIDLLRDNMVLNGTGVNQPMGILANPGGTNHPATVVTGSAAALTGDGLIDLTEALPEQYDENAVLVFNKTNTGKAIRKLKDGDGRPLVSYGAADFGLASGRYREINGYPYIWSGFMPNVGANTYPIVFGDLRGYYLVNRIGFSVQVLRELYAETNQVLLLGRVRFGGMVAEDWRLKIQKVAAS